MIILNLGDFELKHRYNSKEQTEQKYAHLSSFSEEMGGFFKQEI